MGSQSGMNVTYGQANTFVGETCGTTVTTGNQNVIIGANMNVDDAAAGNRIGIGYNHSVNEDNTMQFGMAGNVVSNVFSSNANWAQSSDERLKTSISDNDLGLNFINELKTKIYKWKPSYDVPKELTEHYSEENQKDTDVLMYGMLAQEVKEVMDKYNHSKFTGWSEHKDGSQDLSREMFIIPLVKAVQELSQQVEDLKKKVGE